jgi:pseudouridine synthase
VIDVRLAKYLSRAGVASRRRAEEVIAEGRVSVNEVKVTLPQFKVSADDLVKVDGNTINGEEQKEYYLLNKPPGYISTVKDTHGRSKVTDLIKNREQRVYPVGRLDADSSGVLLLTNDGLLAHRLTHPSYMIKKVYHATVKGNVNKKALEYLRNGPVIEGKKTVPSAVSIIKKYRSSANTKLEIVLTEGKKRQVKKMCLAAGHPVIKLHRFSFAGLTASNLPSGSYRTLNDKEVAQLYRLVGLNKG